MGLRGSEEYKRYMRWQEWKPWSWVTEILPALEVFRTEVCLGVKQGVEVSY